MNAPSKTLHPPLLVLLGGAGLDPWIWEPLQQRLRVPTCAVGHPGARTHFTLADYVDGAHTQTTAVLVEGQQVVVVAHSAGGVVGLELASRLKVRLLGMVAISAVIPRAGQAVVSVLPWPQRLMLKAIMRVVGTRPPKGVLQQELCGGLSSAHAQQVVERFSQESLSLYEQPVGPHGPPQAPRLYVELGKDRALDVTLQRRMAANLGAGETQTLLLGHLPMLEDPAALAAVLEAWLQRHGVPLPTGGPVLHQSNAHDVPPAHHRPH